MTPRRLRLLALFLRFVQFASLFGAPILVCMNANHPIAIGFSFGWLWSVVMYRCDLAIGGLEARAERPRD